MRTMNFASALAAVLISSAGLLSGASTANAESTAAAFNCSLVWNDSATAGIRCTGSSFIGAAVCNNGQVAQGAKAASGTTSYAYCSSVYSSLKIPVQWDAFPA
ncbi:hypothetical protein [Actinokineospora iranica]|uniref:Ig-like domain-containing protein n=1 Tax=Actinokineospora iranica TaxID=1271860 RepID=A0A1G6SIR6_9PSEU|nr:hypothetical protein [Actinokineospora iranica]SDD16782.1 hypothetical protein SAMN05216174_1089 [Actinokineospora iranica]